jgi:hypothetical protein
VKSFQFNGVETTTSLYSDTTTLPDVAKQYGENLVAAGVAVGYRVLFSDDQISWYMDSAVKYQPENYNHMNKLRCNAIPATGIETESGLTHGTVEGSTIALPRM